MNMLNIQKISKYLKPNRKDVTYLIKWRPKEEFTNFLNHKYLESYPLYFKQVKYLCHITIFKKMLLIQLCVFPRSY